MIKAKIKWAILFFFFFEDFELEYKGVWVIGEGGVC